MRTQVSMTSRHRWQFLGFLVGALMLGGFFLARMASAQDRLLLQLDDLPKGFVAVEDRYVGGLDKDVDSGHPLTAINLHDFADEDQQRLFAYTNRQSFGAMNPDVGLVAMNFNYDYASEAEAQWAAEVLQTYLEGKGSTAVDVAADVESETNGLHGKSFVHSNGDEVCHWFYGHRGRTLVIFWVDGFDVDRVTGTYRATLAQLRSP